MNADKRTMTLPSGARYEGEVNDDGRPHGRGVVAYPNGDRFEGEIDAGQIYRGVYTWADGSQYRGIWRGGRVAGGTLRTTDGWRLWFAGKD